MKSLSREDATLILVMISAIGALNVLPSVDAAMRSPAREAAEPVTKSFQSYAVLVGGLGTFTAFATRSPLPLIITGAILFATWRTYDSAVYDADI
jgi:hypothetical protein